MTRDEAAAEAERLRREDPERARYLFAPRRGEDGEWQVARVEVPGGSGSVDLKEGVVAPPVKPSPGQLEPPPQPRPEWGPG